MKRKLISLAAVCAVLASSVGTAALAAAPSDYDGQSYESLGYTSSDSDGQINLAVIANGNVTLGNSFHIEGSVYSNGKIYDRASGGNQVHGLLISGTKNETQYITAGTQDSNGQWISSKTYLDGYYLLNQWDDNLAADDVTYQTKLTTDESGKGDFGTYPGGAYYAGAIYDEDTSFECQYEPFTVPTIANNVGDVTMNVYRAEPDNEKTVAESTAYSTVTMNGTQNANGTKKDAALVIDTTDGDVTVVIDNLVVGSVNPSIKVVGDHEAYIYINNVGSIKDLSINYDLYDWNNRAISGSEDHTHLYLTGDEVTIDAGNIAFADMHVNAKKLQISGSTPSYGNIYSNAETFILTGGTTQQHGTVCVPNADSQVVNSAVLYGQLHTNTLKINGWGSIIWKEDTAVAKADVTVTEAPTAESTEEPAATETPSLPSGGEEISLKGVDYAYIFGYEPDYKEDADGNVTVSVKMAPDDKVTREQVCAMIMRLLDQKYGTMDNRYSMTNNIAQYDGQWFARGLAYMASKGTFDGIDKVDTGNVTRGEVAKLIAFGLNLSETADVSYTDAQDSQYLPYIQMMKCYGYMEGRDDGTFGTDDTMTRGEFCTLFNRITGRDDASKYRLVAVDDDNNEVKVTPETYYFSDLDGNSYEDACLRATSSFESDGTVDLDTRLANIRNVLDNYNSQKKY